MSELKLQQCRLDGRYDVLDCLGRGSYSEVYVARDIAASNGSPQTVVIKALNTSLQGMPDPELERTLIENFRNEAVALDRVRHPHIISRLGHGTAIDLQNRTFHYLVFEYLPGGDLQALCRQRPLSLEAALHYLRQVCAGLAHAHRQGVIHRDIKPQNLLLTADQRTVKIADFGVAKIEADEGLITRVGTDVYAAPEHHPLMQTGRLDTASLTHPIVHLTPAADIYSLAKTTYMLLSGESPRRFSQKPITALPPALARQPWAVYVSHVLERATRTNPERRHQTVEEFWHDIKDATMARTVPLGGAAGPQPAPLEEHEEPRAAPPPTPTPPAPRFERNVEPSQNSTRQRIVVPIAEAAQLERARAEQRGAPPAAAARRRAEPVEFEVPEESRLSPRTRSVLVALFLLSAFVLMLYATYYYVKMRAGSGAQTRQQQQQQQAAEEDTSRVGKRFKTTTDVNLRSGPSRSFGEVGRAELNSRVRVLQVNGKWYEVEVLEHGRAKEDPSSADRGWAHSAYLKPE
jgi:serine/threonine protein kinase